MIVLIILDGWGYSAQKDYNAIAQAHIPQWEAWWATAPKALLACSGEAVGLPHGQMGNSEVGHMHMGAGRVLDQDYSRINKAIENGDFFRNEMLLSTIQKATHDHQAIHVLGLLSPGGVHSHEKHLYALLECLYQQGVRKETHKVYLHLFLDGRDTPPQSAKASLEKLESVLKHYPVAEIKSICGRYFAMDRDSRWDRIACVDDLLTTGKGVFSASTAIEGLENAYARGENDEFIQTTNIGESAPLLDNDTVIFMNYRSDRARQLSRTLVCPDFSAFQRKNTPQLGAFLTLTQYATDIPSTPLFPPIKPQHTLGECVSNAGLKQLRIAETEKYAHVTFFFNGGLETPFPQEDRVLIPSPRVATYDLQPEMSAPLIQEKIVVDLLAKKYDFILANFANADMIGHTGDMAATLRAIECLDDCLKKIAEAAQVVSADIIITADHGNAECMFDPEIHQKHTSHTSFPVPFLYLNYHQEHQVTMTHTEGSLIDIAPTVLYALGLPIPPEMEGKSLIAIKNI